VSGWRAALVALAVGAVVLGLGWAIPRLGAGGDEGPEPTSAPGLVLACVPTLEPACRQIAASSGASFSTWEAGDPLPERGVVVAPAADLPEGTQPGPVVAESPVVIGAWGERASILRSRCGTLDLACVGAALGESWEELGGDDSWGSFKIGLADPTDGQADLLAWSVASGLGTPRLIGESLRLVSSDDARLAAELVLFGDARADLVIGTEAAIAGQFENAIGRGGRLEVYYPAASPWVEYVAAGQGRGSSGLIEALGAAAAEAAFKAAGVRVPGGTGGLPNGLGTPGAEQPPPDATTRATLIAAWEDLR
jgi:hypothetical protein